MVSIIAEGKEEEESNHHQLRRCGMAVNGNRIYPLSKSKAWYLHIMLANRSLHQSSSTLVCQTDLQYDTCFTTAMEHLLVLWR